MDASKRYFSFFLSLALVLGIANFTFASDYNVKKEYVINANINSVLRVVRDYKNYPKLFENIKKVDVRRRNTTESVVYFGIKVLRKKFGALLEFKEYQNNKGTRHQVNCSSIELTNMDSLEGNLYVVKLSETTTKIKIEANIKPSVYIPDFILENMMRREIDEAISNLENLANQNQS